MIFQQGKPERNSGTAFSSPPCVSASTPRSHPHARLVAVRQVKSSQVKSSKEEDVQKPQTSKLHRLLRPNRLTLVCVGVIGETLQVFISNRWQSFAPLPRSVQRSRRSLSHKPKARSSARQYIALSPHLLEGWSSGVECSRQRLEPR